MRRVAENRRTFDHDLRLDIQNRNSSNKVNITFLGLYCARANVSQLTEQQIKFIYKELQGVASNKVIRELVSH